MATDTTMGMERQMVVSLQLLNQSQHFLPDLFPLPGSLGYPMHAMVAHRAWCQVLGPTEESWRVLSLEGAAKDGGSIFISVRLCSNGVGIDTQAKEYANSVVEFGDECRMDKEVIENGNLLMKEVFECQNGIEMEAVCANDIGRHCPHVNGKLSCYWQPTSTPTITVLLYASRAFFEHYSLAVGTSFLARPVRPPLIRRIVLAAADADTFHRASLDDFADSLLLLSALRDFPGMLVRCGDLIPVPWQKPSLVDVNMRVLDCDPTLQGLLTPRSELLLTEISFKKQNDTEFADSSTSCHRPVIVSKFARELVSANPDQTLRVVVAQVEQLLLESERGSSEDVIDPDSIVVCDLQLLVTLGLFEGEWAFMEMQGAQESDKEEQHLQRCKRNTENSEDEKRPNCESERTCEQEPGEEADKNESGEEERKRNFVDVRAVRLFGVSKDSMSKVLGVKSTAVEQLRDTIAVSPSLLFNMQPSPFTSSYPTVKIRANNGDGSVPRTSKTNSKSMLWVPGHATSAHLSPVASPNYNVNGNYDSILHMHFLTPRLLCVGDVISASTLGREAFLDASKGLTPEGWPMLYYKVLHVQGSEDANGNTGYLVDTEHTSLYQEGSVNSPVPWPLAMPDVSITEGRCTDPWPPDVPPGFEAEAKKLREIFLPYLSTRNTSLELPCSLLLCGAPGAGKAGLCRALCRKLHLHLLEVQCVSLRAETAGAAEARLRNLLDEAEDMAPCLVLLRGAENLAREREEHGEETRVIYCLRRALSRRLQGQRKWPVLVVATAITPRAVLPAVSSCFLHNMNLPPYGPITRLNALVQLTRNTPLGLDVSLKDFARRTAGLVLGDLSTLVVLACHAAHKRIREVCCVQGDLSEEEERALCAAGVTIRAQDFELALRELHEKQASSLGAAKVPDVHWEDVGGLDEAKRELMDTMQPPPGLSGLSLRRAGLLLYGPPGTGKTLLAKALATETGMTFLSVKGPELINMYVGQSEENIREVFVRARMAAPCVVFFDELDSLAPSRGHSGDSGGVMDRVVSQLLAELDGCATKECEGDMADGALEGRGDDGNEVYVVGATNRPDLLDPALLRPGRSM
uniref:peroxisome biogenesis factor 6 isoform X2 n=1 Tax=Myxine glutinosa TaxID=7769 RepID=UPI00358EE02A